MPITDQDVLTALSGVLDPELHIPLVKAGMVKDIVLGPGSLRVKVELTTPTSAAKDQIRKEVEAALRTLPELKQIEVQMGWQVRRAPAVGEPGPELAPGVKNIILVGAGKGGVGKSTVALNLAISLARCGAEVGLLDADFYGPSVPVMTGLEAPQIANEGNQMVPVKVHGIQVMSLGFFVAPNQALIWRGPKLHGAVQELLRDVRWGALDYLVIDLPPGTGDVTLSLSQSIKATGAVLVTTPQDVALADVVRAKEMFDKVRIPVLGLVENMSMFVCPHCNESTAIFHHGGGRRAAEMFKVPFLGEIPLTLSIRESGDAGKPISVAAPESAEAKAFMKVAQQVASQASQETFRPRTVTLNQHPSMREAR